MASTYRITAVWNGFQGAPGYSRFSFSNLVDAASRNAAGLQVRTLFDALKSGMQTTWNVLVLPQVDEYDIASGALLASAQMSTVPTIVNGTVAGGNYAGGAGYVITWTTGFVVNGRRVIGRTFFVPAVNVFDVDGTLNAASVTLISNAANAFVTTSGSNFCVWHRTWSGSKPPVQTGGQLFAVSGYRLKDATAQLRSRRI